MRTSNQAQLEPVFYNSNGINTILLFQDHTSIKIFSASRPELFFIIATEMLTVQWYKLELEMIQQLP